MTVINTISPRTSGVRRPANALVAGPRYDRERLVRSRRPGPSRPAGASLRYYGTGVAMSVAPHRKRPATLLTTVGLAVVRVEAGESLRDVAHRVAPDAPARQVADRIRELNDLNSPSLAAGQTL